VWPDLLVVILAAGASRRLGRSKQLVSIGGELLLRRQCRCALDAGVGPVLVVLGHDADRHKRVVADLQLDVRVNDEWQEGIAATLRLAVADARSAAPPYISQNATIVGRDMRVLRKGSAKWTCIPSQPAGVPSPNPMCADAATLQFFSDLRAGKKSTITQWSYAAQLH
jgi:molybdopterin-guanine dinucleotide biosynthesis protein A